MTASLDLGFVVDPLTTLDAGVDSTVGLMAAAQQRGHRVHVVAGTELAVRDGRARAPWRRLHLAAFRRGSGYRWAHPADWYEADEPVWAPVAACDVVFLRTDPPVDRAYLDATYLLDLAGTSVVNDPAGVRVACEHLFPLRWPDLCPPTVVTPYAADVGAFLARHGNAILKPVDGHAGRGVVRLTDGDPNVPSLVEWATRGGRRPVVVQQWLDAVAAGNTRLFVVDGEITGVASRLPAADDFRIGAAPHPADATADDRRIVLALAPALKKHGLRVAGVDVIDGRLIEVNVTSPGAMRKADAVLGTDLCGDVVDRLTATVTRRTA